MTTEAEICTDVVTGFEESGSPETRNVGGPQTLERARKHIQVFLKKEY